MLNKKNTKVLITGASSGIGRALVAELVTNGYTVIGLARRKNLINVGLSFECDVSNENEVKNVFTELEKQNSLPDIIVSCAGIHEEDLTPVFDISKIRKTIDVNFWGTINMVGTFLPYFLQKKSGHFIVLSSIASWKPSSRGVSYSASKASIAMAFRGLDLAYKKSGVNFSTIYLGPVETEMWEGRKSFVVTKPENIAKSIAKVLENPKPVIYMPFLSTTLSRLALLIPDWLYAKLSTYLFK